MNRKNEPKNSELALADTMEAIDKAVGECSIEAIQSLPVMQQTIVLANGMTALREAITPEIVEKVFMPLMGTPLGFRTDKDDEETHYAPIVVRDCVIEAMIRGFRPIGNEFNIIAGRAYFTKEGFERKVAEFKGLTNLALFPGLPHMKDGGAIVAYTATFLLNGKSERFVCDVVTEGDHTMDLRIPVRVNRGMGADAVLGKAKRKFFARLYERISGVRTPDGELDEDGTIDTTGTAAPELPAKSQAEKLADKHKDGPPGQQDLPEREPGQEG